MKIKKILSVLLTLCLFVNVSFAFDPYADEEVEKKSYKKLYYGIALTLLGGFLAYDGFSLEKVDVSRPSVDFLTVSHSEWIQNPIKTGEVQFEYQSRSGVSLNNVLSNDDDTNGNNNAEATSGQSEFTDYTKYEVLKPGGKAFNPPAQTYDPEQYDQYTVEPNRIYNNGNVDLEKITIEVRYKYADGTYISDSAGTPVTTGGYHVAGTNKDATAPPQGEEAVYYTNITLAKGESTTWQDIFDYNSAGTSQPMGDARSAHEAYHKGTGEQSGKEFFNPGMEGLNLGKESTILMEVRVILNKNQQYIPIYETRHKSDLEGVAGMFIGIAGIYFIIDHFFDMHKFNAYARRHHLNLKVATASNQYKLMLQKRI